MSGAFHDFCGGPVMVGAAMLSMALPVAASGESAEDEAAKPLAADAAEAADWGAVEGLIDSGAAVDAPQPDGMRALHWAVRHDALDAVRALLAAGADAGAANRYGIAPLTIACWTGNADVIRSLLDAGADPDTAQRGGETALMTAARTGRLAAVRVLLDAGAKIDAQERRGQTAIMWAAAEGHADVVELLMARGADPRAALHSGFTPMFFAVREGHRDVVALLLEAGIDVNAAIEEKRGGRSPRAGTSALMLAIENGHFALAADLLDAGADPNDARSGFTPLHALTWVRKPNRGDGDDGLPPPVGSGKRTSLDMARDLIARGADVNAQLESGSSGGPSLGRKGATPLLLAAKTADLPLIALLVENGADPLIANADGSTPLMAAAGLGTHAPTEEAGTEPEAMAVAEFLLARGADVNAVDKNGETVMHGAAYKSFPEMTALLDEAGADPAVWNTKNRHGWTPLIIAQGFRPGNFKPSEETEAAIAAVMRKHGIDPPPPPKRSQEREDWEEKKP